jgi:nucleotide-binding universal stress UspA family protein
MNDLVVGVDGSEESRRALRWAASVADAARSQLLVVEAWSYPTFSILGEGGDLAAPDKMDERVTQDLQEASTEVLGGAAANVDIKFEALRGPAAGAILQRVTPDSALVLGSRGRGGFLGLLLGSVSRECIEHAPCPVIIVRHESTPLPTGSTILVGHDGSPSAAQALQWAVALAQPTGAKVVAAYVWQTGASEVRPRLHKRLTAHAASSIEKWARAISDDVHPMAVEGEARTDLTKLAESLNTGLVVVGRRGEGHVRALRMGSVASYLATSSPVAIAVIPSPASVGDGPDAQ